MALSVTEEQAISICASHAFARKLSTNSPYRDFTELIEAARHIWWRDIGPSEWLAAFAAHPRIGESKAAVEKSEEFAAFSRSEQETAAQTTDSEVSKELQHWNKLYFDKFGFIFIIFAKGRSSPEILSCLKERFQRLPYEELQSCK
ncbi:hypothetical protein CEUSTIGMA_g1229.t1 [Chlamydomonas eustigma]|uniref:2-oxo-4-hydroxy-4-carboxy-5-ureidoimidazoline decarboxylase n=1 Tax=Chlamydomonas eustigma TaxID=1157962 RepID=A0A250WSG4_9CHLO|nr:hypothetical protein CEUSTIGMA_g1229.t1 [Chlamydomonas eustigma]|eukprot:GAX73778.1 hypothetical protein CEUSTIGMA_g1229.t1 [Chlamydomonas eustigma]